MKGLGYIHSKVFLIDDKVAFIGSVNGSDRAINFNREFGYIITDSNLSFLKGYYWMIIIHL